MPKNTTQYPGLEPGPFDPESSALTIRPPRLPRAYDIGEKYYKAFKEELRGEVKSHKLKNSMIS